MEGSGIHLIRTDAANIDFIELVKELDADLAERDGKEHQFYAPFNTISNIKQAVVAYKDGKPVSCGAFNEYGPQVVEIKRMYTRPESRGAGIAAKVLIELENWAAELGYKKCILETGKKQPEAIRLYQKSGYQLIPNYGPYTNVENSVCFEKVISA